MILLTVQFGRNKRPALSKKR